MIEFTVYDSTTGKVNSTGTCPEDQFECQGRGYSLSLGSYPSDKYYWDNEFIEKPAKPDGDYFFDYYTKQWVQNTAFTIAKNKAKRNQLLAQSDWTQGADSPLSAEVKASWATYRQALRDMTEQDYLDDNFPENPLTVPPIN